MIGPALRLDRPAEIRIGFGKSPSLFAANGRPRRIRVHLLAGLGDDLARLRVVSTGEVTLEDIEGFQPLPRPAPAVAPAPDLQTFVAVEILEVTRGAKYQDTCITDIRESRDASASGGSVRFGTPWPAVLPCARPATVVCTSNASSARWVRVRES